MTELESLKEFLAVAMAVFAIITTGGSVAGTWILLKWRMDRLDHVVFGNGNQGILDELKSIEIRCATNHGRDIIAGEKTK